MLLDPTQLITSSFGLVILVVIVFVESGFPFGFFLPGDTLLFTAGLLASKGHFSIALAITLIFLANFTGVTIGYLSGRGLGKRYIKEESGFLFRHDYVEKASRFYENHGGKAIILARFVPAVRSFVPLIAGVAGMNYRKLMIYNAIGAAVWAISIPLIGYYAGAWLEARGVNVDAFILPVIGLIVLVSLAAPVIHALSDRQTRARLFARFKK